MWAQDQSPDVMVGREGIEPPQSKTADLQSAELTTCSTYPSVRRRRRTETAVSWWARRPMNWRWSRRWDSNPQPAVYKTAALPIELRRRDRQGHTADDPFRRREMIGPAGRTGQARPDPVSSMAWSVVAAAACRLAPPMRSGGALPRSSMQACWFRRRTRRKRGWARVGRARN